ncbi:MAG TPA: hypothetical protein VHA06_22530 [Candidatus Angelobacter sp.]|jgi:hypothetical protein|nr:hypothetical protein [Candidatus Angelobacter sp.]
MKWMVQLYPAAWRQRYGEEFAAVLAEQRASPGLILDVLGGAVDARLHPQVRGEKKNSKGEETMTNEMMQRCAAGGPKLSKEDQKIASMAVVFSSLFFTILYLVLTKIYHAKPAVEALGYASFPAIWMVYEQTAYLRKRKVSTQAVISLGIMGAMYLFMLGACEIAARL